MGNLPLKQIETLHKNNQEANQITKESIEQALLQLMAKKEYSKISITDITRRAGVSRTAYYRNYSSKDDILSHYIQSIGKKMSDALNKYDAITETKKSWLTLLDEVDYYSIQFKVLLNAGFAEKILLEFQKSMNEGISPKQVNLYYSNIYWAGAITSIVFAWVKNDMNVSKEKIATLGCSLMTDGIKTTSLFGNQC